MSNIGEMCNNLNFLNGTLPLPIWEFDLVDFKFISANDNNISVFLFGKTRKCLWNLFYTV